VSKWEWRMFSSYVMANGEKRDCGEITCDGNLIADIVDREHAALIVRAVNSHADLVAALEIIANDDGYAGVRTAEFKAIARAALAKVKGED
jgi:hypothetical protein